MFQNRLEILCLLLVLCYSVENGCKEDESQFIFQYLLEQVDRMEQTSNNVVIES